MYEAEYSEPFKEKIAGPRFRYIAKRIKSKCELIRQMPYGACHSERLKGNYVGKRSGQLDERLRVIYIVCEECMKHGDQQWNLDNCAKCLGLPKKLIKFIDIVDYH